VTKRLLAGDDREVGDRAVEQGSLLRGATDTAV